MAQKITGGVAAGPRAAARVKRCNPKAKVAVMDRAAIYPTRMRAALLRYKDVIAKGYDCHT